MVLAYHCTRLSSVHSTILFRDTISSTNSSQSCRKNISSCMFGLLVYQIMNASAQRSALVDLKNVQNVPFALIILIVVVINTVRADVVLVVKVILANCSYPLHCRAPGECCRTGKCLKCPGTGCASNFECTSGKHCCIREGDKADVIQAA